MTEKIKCGQEKPIEERKEALAKILMGAEGGRIPEAVFILSGGIKEIVEPENKYDFLSRDRFFSNSYLDADYTGAITGGEARVVAGSELSKVFPELTFVTTSRGRKDEPSHSTVQAAELEQLGVKDEKILLEENSTTTITEFVEMIKIANEKAWDKIAILTSDYHIPRYKMMWEKLANLIEGADVSDVYKEEFLKALAEFKRNNSQIIFVGAEEVLEKVNDDYRVLVKEAKESEGYKKRVELEEEGVKNLEENKYEVRIIP